MPMLRPDHIFDDIKRAAAVSGRLADGVTATQAEAELNLLSEQFRKDRRLDPHHVALISTTFFPNPAKRRNADQTLATMFAAVVMVLGLACANVANLLLARGAARRRETAARLALGASRGRIVRQLLTESLVLATAALAVGIAVAYILPPILLAQMSAKPLAIPLDPDRRVLAFAVSLALLACIAFGLAPALHGSRGDVSTALKEKSGIAGSHTRLRGILLALQVAISLVLLVSGSLIARGVQHAAAQDPGFDMAGVSVISFELPGSYTTTRLRAFAVQIVDDLPVLAGRSSGLADTPPFVQGNGLWTTVHLPGAPETRNDDALRLEVSAGYLDTLGIAIVEGRNLDAADKNRDVVLVSESVARRLWGSNSGLGQRVIVGPGSKGAGPLDFEVVGIVKDVSTYYGNVTSAFPTIYVPIAGRTIPRVLVRRLDPGLTHAISAFVRRIEPRTKITVTSVADSFDKRLAQSRFAAWVAGILGLLSVCLAGMGVFSVFAYTVAQRASEIGIRLALGAPPARIVATLLGSNVRPLLGGLVVGVGCALAAARIIRSFLHGLSPFDPAAFVAVVVVLTLVAVAATFLPTRRAIHIDPATTLRAGQ
jgi:predicted permease